MKASVVVLLLSLAATVLSQGNPQNNLSPVTMDGFDTVWLDDMSFVNEFHYQTLPWWCPSLICGNVTFYVFGGGRARTIIPYQNPAGVWTFTVAGTPDFMKVPFVDVHSFTIQNQPDAPAWFFGPTNPISGQTNPGGGAYQLEIAAFSTANQNAIFQAPIGFNGTFYAVSTVPYNASNVIAYFVGFFETGVDANAKLNFGVYRAHLDTTPTTPTLTFNATVDIAVINTALFTTYHSSFKPFIFHLWNQTIMNGGEVANTTTYTYVIDSANQLISLITGTVFANESLKLFADPINIPIPQGGTNSFVSSAVVHYGLNLLFVGVGSMGMGTGAILVYDLQQKFATGKPFLAQTVTLPTNYSDPKALVVDYFGNALIIGLNGGGAILNYSINTASRQLGELPVGQQNLPYYLHRVWAGAATPGHVYFSTNEQHAKVFRMARGDFCTSLCPYPFGYCSAGTCKCSPPFELKDNQCQFLQQTPHDREIIKREKAGETALGILFMFAFIAAAVGWFLWYRQRRHSYQSV